MNLDLASQTQSQNLMGIMDNLLASDDEAPHNDNRKHNIQSSQDSGPEDSQSQEQTPQKNNENESNITNGVQNPSAALNINTEMISRHNRFQKLLAKRANRVQKLNTIVNKTILEVSGDAKIDANETETTNNAKEDSAAKFKIFQIPQFKFGSSMLKKAKPPSEEQDSFTEKEKTQKESESAIQESQILQEQKELPVAETQLLLATAKSTPTQVISQRDNNANNAYSNYIASSNTDNTQTIPFQRASDTSIVNDTTPKDADNAQQAPQSPTKISAGNALFVSEEDEGEEMALATNKEDNVEDEAARAKREQRLIQDMEEEDRILRDLESKMGSNTIKDKKNKKELLDIAMKTQELSLKYNLEPVLYNRIEIKKDDLLSEFGFRNGEFQPMAQRKQEHSSPNSTGASSGHDEDVIIADDDTDLSDMELNIGEGKKQDSEFAKKDETSMDLSKNFSTDPLFKYTQKLKQDANSKGEIVLDSDSDSEGSAKGSQNNDNDDDPRAGVSKAKLFEIKLKFARKSQQRKQKQAGKAAAAVEANDKSKKPANLSKEDMFKMFMLKHRDAVRKHKQEQEETITGGMFENDKDDDIFGDDKFGNGGNGDQISVQKLVEQEMAYKLRQAERLRAQKENGSDADEDSDYVEESSDGESGNELEENDDDNVKAISDEENIEDKKTAKLENKKVDVLASFDQGNDNAQEKTETQIHYNKDIVVSDAEEEEEEEEEEEGLYIPKAKRHSSKKNVLLDSDDEEVEAETSSKPTQLGLGTAGIESSFQLDTQKLQPPSLNAQNVSCSAANYDDGNDDDEAEINLLNSNGLTQKLNNIFGKNVNNLSQAFDASIKPTDKISTQPLSFATQNTQPKSSSSRSIIQKLRKLDNAVMNDNMEDGGALGLINDDENTSFETSFLKQQSKPKRNFVPGFEFEDSLQQNTNGDDDETPVGTERILAATEADIETQLDVGDKDDDREVAEEKVPKKTRRLQRKRVVEDDENDDDDDDGDDDADDESEEGEESEEEQIDPEKQERLRIEEARRQFALDRERELQKKKREQELEKAGVKEIFDQEAVESEDEWQGFGGKDRDDMDVANSEDEKMIDNITKVSSKDNEELIKLINNEDLANDQKMVEKLMNDIKNGKLGKRGNSYMDLDEDDEFDEELAKFHRLRYEKQKARLLQDQKVNELIKNKKTRAFFQTIAEETNTHKLKSVLGENLDYVSEDEESSLPDADQKTQQQQPKQEIPDQQRNGKEDAGSQDQPATKKRKVKLDEEYIRKTLSFLDSEDESEHPYMDKHGEGNSSDVECDMHELKQRSIFNKGFLLTSSTSGGNSSRNGSVGNSRSNSTAGKVFSIDDNDDDKEGRSIGNGVGSRLSIIESNSILRKSSSMNSSIFDSYRSFKENIRSEISEGKASEVIVSKGYKAVNGNSASITYLHNKSVVNKKRTLGVGQRRR